MKLLTFRATWSSTHTIEVEDDVAARIEAAPHLLASYPDDVLDEVDTSIAELTDWDVTVNDAPASEDPKTLGGAS